MEHLLCDIGSLEYGNSALETIVRLILFQEKLIDKPITVNLLYHDGKEKEIISPNDSKYIAKYLSGYALSKHGNEDEEPYYFVPLYINSDSVISCLRLLELTVKNTSMDMFDGKKGTEFTWAIVEALSGTMKIDADFYKEVLGDPPPYIKLEMVKECREDVLNIRNTMLEIWDDIEIGCKRRTSIIMELLTEHNPYGHKIDLDNLVRNKVDSKIIDYVWIGRHYTPWRDFVEDMLYKIVERVVNLKLHPNYRSNKEEDLELWDIMELLYVSTCIDTKVERLSDDYVKRLVNCIGPYPPYMKYMFSNACEKDKKIIIQLFKDFAGSLEPTLLEGLVNYVFQNYYVGCLTGEELKKDRIMKLMTGSRDQDHVIFRLMIEKYIVIKPLLDTIYMFISLVKNFSDKLKDIEFLRQVNSVFGRGNIVYTLFYRYLDDLQIPCIPEIGVVHEDHDKDAKMLELTATDKDIWKTTKDYIDFCNYMKVEVQKIFDSINKNIEQRIETAKKQNDSLIISRRDKILKEHSVTTQRHLVKLFVEELREYKSDEVLKKIIQKLRDMRDLDEFLMTEKIHEHVRNLLYLEPDDFKKNVTLSSYCNRYGDDPIYKELIKKYEDWKVVQNENGNVEHLKK